jgi:hypothetical protein
VRGFLPVERWPPVEEVMEASHENLKSYSLETIVSVLEFAHEGFVRNVLPKPLCLAVTDLCNGTGALNTLSVVGSPFHSCIHSGDR